MELTNEFEIPLSLDDAWRVLTDLEQVAPCMPGAQLQEVEGNEYRGVVRVKVGPITVDYRGSATFVELDEGSHSAVLRATGRETRGQGNATATVRATLEPRANSTHVLITTELDITGRVAQFGRGALADVSTRLLGQFADNLAASLGNRAGGGDPTDNESALAEPASPSSAESAEDQAVAVRRIDAAPVEPVKLTSLVAGPFVKALAPIVAVLVALGIVLRRRLGRRS